MSDEAEALAKKIGLARPCGVPGVRRSGNTTSMLLEALVEVTKGKRVFILAHDARYAHDLVRQLRRWALQLGMGVPMNGIVPLTERGLGVRDDGHTAIFVDHFADETEDLDDPDIRA
jgi:hypothetical protein